MVTPNDSNRSSIASRLIELESRQPGPLRIRISPFGAAPLAKMLKDMGFKKPMLQSPQQFIVNCALSYHQALHTLLDVTFLSGPIKNGAFPCWWGNGQYAGILSYFKLSDFSYLSSNNIYVVINIESYIVQLDGLLAPCED